MSYQKDLDEYRDEELLNELQRRQAMRKQGRCSYCKQPIHSEKECRLHDFGITHQATLLAFEVYRRKND